jgi:hypothetical protein
MLRTIVCYLSLAVLSACSLSQIPGQVTSPLRSKASYALPAGTAKFDHFAVDLSANRLFIAATGNRSIEVLDLGSGQIVASLTGLGKPHGLAWIPASSRLYASDGVQADLRIFEGAPLKPSKSIKLSTDADDMVFDARTKLLYVGHGGGDAANPASIAVIDTSNQSLLTNLRVDVHPEGLEIDEKTDRIFANIADAAEVLVIDGPTHTPSATWKLTRAKDNVPLAYDDEHQILFVACRNPARLLVLDGKTGKELADLPSDTGADDLFYDPELHRVYLIAGAGAIDVYEVNSAKTVHAIGVTPTSPGAKTGLFVPSLHTLYVGAAADGDKQAQILVYSTK